jgi:hypothetical protein
MSARLLSIPECLNITYWVIVVYSSHPSKVKEQDKGITTVSTCSTARAGSRRWPAASHKPYLVATLGVWNLQHKEPPAQNFQLSENGHDEGPCDVDRADAFACP